MQELWFKYLSPKEHADLLELGTEEKSNCFE